MLRTIFVLALLAFGLRHAVRGPFYAMLFYLWIAYFRPEEWVWSGSLIQELNFSLLVGVFTLLLAFFSGQLTFNGRLVVVALMLLQSLLSTLSSEYVSYSWPYFVGFAKCAMITWILASLTTDVARLRLVLVVITLSLGFETVKQGWVTLVLNPGGKNFNAIGLLGDNNGVAVGMFVLTPIAVALAKTASRKWERWGYRFAAIGIVYRGISTYSRGGFLCAAIVGGLYILRSKRKLAAIVGLALVCAVVLPVLPAEFWDRMSSISTATETTETSDANADDNGDQASAVSRLHFWRTAVSMADDYPVLGIGYNAFTQAYDRYDTLNGLYGRGRSVHSSWFGVLAELGYPGLVLVFTSFGLAWIACRRAIRTAKARNMVEFGEFAGALETGLIVILVGGAFVPFQYTEMLWHVIGLTIAVNRIALQSAASPARASAVTEPVPA